MSGCVAVTYRPDVVIDVSRPLLIDRQLLWAEWFNIEIDYPETGKAPPEALFRQARSVLIHPVIESSSRHLRLLVDEQIAAGNVRERYWMVVDGELLWALLHIQPSGVDCASVYIYRRR